VIAITRRLDQEVDLLDVAGPDGLLVLDPELQLAGRGEARRVPVADAVAVLAGIEVRDDVCRPGTGPVAFTALPFGSTDAATVVIPSIIVGRASDGTAWVTRIGDDDLPLVAPVAARPQPSSFTVTPARSPESWCDAVGTAVERIRGGRLTKVVLAREVVVDTDVDIDPLTVLRRLRSAYPTTTVFSLDGLVGATPELLVSRVGEVVRSHPFAGTIPRTGDDEADARAATDLLASPKERAEHQITIDTVLDTLLPFCSYVDFEPEPSVVRLANVQHLATYVEGRLSDPPATVLSLVEALHPTPAVCGWPIDVARETIAELEQLDRGRYAGAVGWMDRNGDGSFAIAIRCAVLRGRRAHLYAGMGIVADSDPLTELAETRAKLQAMLGALVRP
jgi:isochorismate synthase